MSVFTVIGAARTFGYAGASLGAVALFQAAHAQGTPSNFTFGTRYDSAGHVVGEIMPDPDAGGGLRYPAIRNTYDNAGNLIRLEKGELSNWMSESITPSNWVGFTVLTTIDYTYDSIGRRVTEQVKGSGGVVVSRKQFSYDTIGQLECIAVRMNQAKFSSPPNADACARDDLGHTQTDRITKHLYDAAGQLLQVKEAVGTSKEQSAVTFSYTPNGKRQNVTDAKGHTSRYEYDGFDRLSKWYFPFKAAPGYHNPNDYEEYGYDSSGNRISLRMRDSYTITYEFDSMNRLTKKLLPSRSWPDATHRRNVFYTYDARGSMTAARFDGVNGEGVTNAYDGFGRLVSSTTAMDGVSRTVSSSYNQNGGRWKMTFPDGQYAEYEFDQLDRMQWAGNSGTSGLARTYKYNNRGSLASDTVSNNGGVASYQYDSAGRLSSLNVNVAGTASDFSNSFAYNTASQVNWESRTNDGYAYTGRLNVSRSHTPNGLNQYTAVSGTTYCYDQMGNLVFDGTHIYVYDVERRLILKWKAGVGSSCGSLQYETRVVELRYDPLGRLYETKGAMTGNKRYLMDGNDLIAEYNFSNVMERRYIHGAGRGLDDPIFYFSGNTLNASNAYSYFSDRQGSIVLTADVAGNAHNMFTYDEHGVPKNPGPGNNLYPAVGARFLYTGQVWILDLGMYYYKARVYSPTLGRYMQTDPIGYYDSLNLYTYVGNDPLNRVDPTGLYGSCAGTDVICVVAQPPSPMPILPLVFPQASIPSVPSFPAASAPQSDGRICGVGPRVSYGVQFSGTGFLASFGLSGSIGIGVSVPANPIESGSQIYLTGSLTGLAGLGFFAGAGPSGVVGASNGPLSPGFSTSTSVGVQGGAAAGGGGEVAVLTDSSGSGSSSGSLSGGPRAGMGGYLAGAAQGSASLASPLIGC